MTLLAPHGSEGRLNRFWATYFRETPTCTYADCTAIAKEVDPYFPYIDDLNRCGQHMTMDGEYPQHALS